MVLLKKNNDYSLIKYKSILQGIGIKCERLCSDSDLIKVSYKDHIEFLSNAEFPYIPLGYKNIISDCFFSKQLFLTKKIPTLPGEVFNKNELEKAHSYIQNTIGWPIVIKPTNKNYDSMVFCAIQNSKEFNNVWQDHILPNTNFYYLIEACWSFCPDYHFIVFKNDKTAVLKRTSPFIRGDGKRNISQLVNIINQRRQKNPYGGLCEIIVSDQDAVRCLNSQNLSLLSVPAKGEIVYLRYMSNIQFGGMSETIDNSIIHPSYWSLLTSIWDLFPDLPYIAVDLLSWDISKPVTVDNVVVKSLHTACNIAMYQFPGKGESVDVLTPLLKIIFPEIELV